VTEFGAPRLHLRLTDSTNERARELAEAGAPSGTVVTAAAQTAGRGRRGRAWSAPEGKALLCSALLSPLGPEHALLPLAVPVAVCEAIESLAALECRIKWPNDVWIEERKVAGVLIEARPPQWAVIGIGVNVAIEPDEFPDDLRWPATSVGGGATVDGVLAAVCERLERWAGAERGEILDAFRDRDVLSEQEIEWEDGEGRAAGIDDDGELIVELGDGSRVALGAGDVSLRLRTRGD
jgi:BirA family biotin operon repressor/biotin-[acetyl-CoA-carboxylase] ligase